MELSTQRVHAFDVPVDRREISPQLVGNGTPAHSDDHSINQFVAGAPFDGEKPAMVRRDGARLALFMNTVDRWLMMRPIPLIGALLADTRLSRRQVERNFKTLYGKSPKSLARRARARHAVNAIAANPEAADDIVEYGYYDQSHMIREIKHFTGKTPGQIKSGLRFLQTPSSEHIVMRQSS
jgi:AraC-like DNA-binding protein